MAKMPKHSNDMPKGPDASRVKPGAEGYMSGAGSYSGKFGQPGGPNPGVHPTKTMNSLKTGSKAPKKV